MKRVHLIISGDVQGVGFRAWVRGKAKKMELTGWVKNTDDGAVEVMAEGEKEKLDALLKECQRGPEGAWVAKVVMNWEEAMNEFIRFDVVY